MVHRCIRHTELLLLLSLFNLLLCTHGAMHWFAAPAPVSESRTRSVLSVSKPVHLCCLLSLCLVLFSLPCHTLSYLTLPCFLLSCSYSCEIISTNNPTMKKTCNNCLFSSCYHFSIASLMSYSYTVSVLGQKVGYTLKYGPRNSPRAVPSGNPAGSGDILRYIPPLVLIRTLSHS